MSKALLDFLQLEHKVYQDCKDEWLMNERRLRGGLEVIDAELSPFEWEKPQGKHFAQRKRQATYVNFPARMSTVVVGQIADHAPKPGSGMSFGALGEYDRDAEVPSRATQLYHDVDAAGNQSSQWDQWFNGVQRRAMATGHRWVMVESPSSNPGQRTVQDELDGERPYAVEYSPLDVPNWQMRNGGLDFVVIRVEDTSAYIENGAVKQGGRPMYYLHVQRGYDVLDEIQPDTHEIPFSRGGWWKIDEEGALIDEGEYASTNGRIPIVALYHQKTKGGTQPVTANDESDETPPKARISLPGLTEIGQIAVSYMNIGSAGDNDAIQGGSRTIYVSGITDKEHEVVASQQSAGSRLIGIPPGKTGGGQPTIYDMGSASASGAVEKRQERKEHEAELTALDVLGLGTAQSGEAKKVSYRNTRKPVLVLAAENRESAEESVLRLFEMRWAQSAPSARIEWNMEFDLTATLQTIGDLFQVSRRSGAQSSTMTSNLIVAALRDSGLDAVFQDEELDTVRDELEASINREEQAIDATLGPGI